MKALVGAHEPGHAVPGCLGLPTVAPSEAKQELVSPSSLAANFLPQLRRQPLRGIQIAQDDARIGREEHKAWDPNGHPENDRNCDGEMGTCMGWLSLEIWAHLRESFREVTLRQETLARCEAL